MTTAINQEEEDNYDMLGEREESAATLEAPLLTYRSAHCHNRISALSLHKKQNTAQRAKTEAVAMMNFDTETTTEDDQASNDDVGSF